MNVLCCIDLSVSVSVCLSVFRDTYRRKIVDHAGHHLDEGGREAEHDPHENDEGVVYGGPGRLPPDKLGGEQHLVPVVGHEEGAPDEECGHAQHKEDGAAIAVEGSPGGAAAAAFLLLLLPVVLVRRPAVSVPMEGQGGVGLLLHLQPIALLPASSHRDADMLLRLVVVVLLILWPFPCCWCWCCCSDVHRRSHR